jgi:hypothetical protein
MAEGTAPARRDEVRAFRERARALLSVWTLAVAGLLGLALLLRLWGFRHGLPYIYNADESAHFVPQAVRFYDGDYNPHYFRNPPAFTYLLHGSFRAAFPGEDVPQTYADDPGDVVAVARVVSALLGTLAVALVYLLGARLFDRRVGLVAGAVLAVAFLPVFYSHLALNDVPALVPLTLSLVGAAGVLRWGRLRDYAVAGAGLGLGAATKYTAGIALVSLLAAGGIRHAAPEERRRVLAGIALGGAAAVAAFLAANPYALLDFDSFRDALASQSRLSERHKLGLTEDNGFRFYLWTFTWGLGWLPALAGLVGAGLLALRDRLLALVLVPLPLLYLLYMGTQERLFGRWLLPAFPVVCVLAGYAAVRLADVVAGRRQRLARFALPVAVAALVIQGLVYSVHNDVVLSRTDTRTLTREWMVAHLPPGTPVAIEPFVPYRQWLRLGEPDRHPRWHRDTRVAGIEDYARGLRPELVDEYALAGTCWVVTASTVSGRAFAQPYRAPAAIAYYYELEQRGEVAYRALPYPRPERVPFDFDWSFDYYPLAYRRPGPEVTVYRLRDCVPTG